MSSNTWVVWKNTEKSTKHFGKIEMLNVSKSYKYIIYVQLRPRAWERQGGVDIVMAVPRALKVFQGDFYAQLLLIKGI
jgi:hypothetical protein